MVLAPTFMQTRFHGKGFSVLGALFLYQDIGGLGVTGGVDNLLQGGFVIGDGNGGAAGNVAQLGKEYALQDQLPRFLQARIQVYGCHYRFQSIYQQGSLAAPPALFLAPAQGQVVAQVQFAGYPHQVPPAYQVGAQLREVPFLEFRITAVELFAGYEAQHGIAQELELLVIYDFTARAGFLLARPGTVGQRPVQQVRALKMMPQERFQRGYLRFLHDRPAGAYSGCPAAQPVNLRYGCGVSGCGEVGGGVCGLGWPAGVPLPASCFSRLCSWRESWPTVVFS